MKLTKSLILGLESFALVFACFMLFFLETRIGNAYLFLAIKILIFAALFFISPLLFEKENRKKENYFKRLLDGNNVNKTSFVNIALFALSAGLLYFFSAFCYSGVIGLYEAVTEQIVVFGSSSAVNAGTIAISVLLKGILLPVFVSSFYYGCGGKLYRNKKYGTVALILFATFTEFSIDGVLVLLCLNILLGIIESKTNSAIVPMIAYTVYSLCGVIVSFAGELPYSYKLITSVETAWYYSAISFGIGLICLAASIVTASFVKPEVTNVKKEVASGEEKFVFFGACVLYLVLTIAIYAIV